MVHHRTLLAFFMSCLLPWTTLAQSLDVWEDDLCRDMTDTDALIERVSLADQRNPTTAHGNAGTLDVHIAENGRNNFVLTWKGPSIPEVRQIASSVDGIGEQVQTMLSTVKQGNPNAPSRFLLTYHASTTQVQCAAVLEVLTTSLQKKRDDWCMTQVGMSEDQIKTSGTNATSPAMKGVFENLLQELETAYPAWQWHQKKPEPPKLSVVEADDEEVEEEDIPFMIVEDMPALGPCKNLVGPERGQCTQLEIIKFTSSNTRYPPIAKDAGIQGTVFVYFVVGKDGKVKDSKVLRPVDPRLDAEALRVVSSLPDFDPGRLQGGKPVSVQYTIPVKFMIR